jgi:hypothetical protein
MQQSWFAMAYMVSDKPAGFGLSVLDDVVQREIFELVGAGERAQMDVAVQVDFKKPTGRYRISTNGVSTQRYAPSVTTIGHLESLGKNEFWNAVHEKLTAARESKITVTASEEENSATPGVLEEFLRWCHPYYPGQRQALLLYGHAAGPMGLFFDATPGSVDPPDILGLNELANALKAIGPVDIILFRSCFMNTLEAAFELQEVSSCLVGPELEVPSDKPWPWIDMMRVLQFGKAAPPMARAIAKRLGTFYEDPINLDETKHNKGIKDVPMSCLDLQAVSKVKKALNDLVVELENARSDLQRRNACMEKFESSRHGDAFNLQKPGDPALLDVRTLCKNLSTLDPDPIAGFARDLNKAIGDLVFWSESTEKVYNGVCVYYQPISDEETQKSDIEGVFDWIGRPNGNKYYRNLRLSRETGWNRIALSPFRPDK